MTGVLFEVKGLLFNKEKVLEVNDDNFFIQYPFVSIITDVKKGDTLPDGSTISQFDSGKRLSIDGHSAYVSDDVFSYLLWALHTSPAGEQLIKRSKSRIDRYNNYLNDMNRRPLNK